MPDFILLMRDDGTEGGNWQSYLAALQTTGAFKGGSSIGAGIVARKGAPAEPTSSRLMGFVRIEARDIAHAQSLLAGNPAFEGGCSVEVRELIED
jgi:hypothetical protein